VPIAEPQFNNTTILIFHFDFFGYCIGGIVLIFLSIMMTLFSLDSYNLAKRDTLVPYIKQRLFEEEIKITDKLLEAVGVKIPQKECPYCKQVSKLNWKKDVF